MRKLAFGLLLLASANAFAEQSPADEISARSGLPASEVSALLADCDSNQTSMNFCAWRDQIVAERELQQVVDQQVSQHPERKAALEAKVAKWKKARDASCEKSARKEWDDGSMRPAAQAICATASTKKMTRKLSATAPRRSS
ncbi:lysozyme inhibitor LprI family protein [Burkholderia ubonensis]|uniref:lysozyme inhibitor LprI family protein n=1 Tax=Burkholderia ubonensis TaxID=101571 RepID=UPI002ABE922E|nr:lysozyme inhibitor LprI family protein [Burkholderia ubonensis]